MILFSSLYAFEKTFQLGADGIEVDVRLCKTGEVIVFHDFYLKRMTGVSGFVRNRSLNIIKNLDLISKNGFQKNKIPLLTETLELVRDYNGLINIDIKKDMLNKNQLERKILGHIKDFKLDEQVIISSFNPIVLKAIKTENPKIKTGFIYKNRPYAWFSNSKYYDSLHPNYSFINRKFLETAKSKGKTVHVWTVDRGEEIKYFLDLGVEAIITNRPEVAVGIIKN